MGERQLLFSVTKKDFRIDTFRAGGKGGQKQNKTESGVRLTHIASGAVGESRVERSQPQNKILAFRNLINSKKFKTWLKIETSRRLGAFKNIEKDVEDAMQEKNLRIEVKDENERWVEAKEILAQPDMDS